MITRVRIENWKSHLKSELEFAEGTNALVGIMGSGKTSVLDAITYGLFGTFSALQQRRVKLDNIIRTKPNKAEYAEVAVRFIAADGKEYEATRRVEEGKSTAELRQDGKLIATAPARVNEAIEGLLKLDFDLYSRAIYSEQNKIDSFLTIARGQRMKKIDELLRIDKFESARKNCTSIINQLSDRAASKENLLSVREKDIAGAEELAVKVSELKRQREQVQEAHQKKTDEKRAQEETVKTLDQMKERTDRLEERVIMLEGRGKEIWTELEKSRKRTEGLEKQATEADLVRLEGELAKKDAETKHLRGEHIQQNAQYLALKKSSEEATAKIVRMELQLKKKIEIEQEFGPNEKIEARIREIGEEIEKGRAERSHLQARKEISEKSISELSEGQCPVCESPLTAERAGKLAEEHREKIKGYQRGIAESENSARKLSEERTKLENTLKKAGEILRDTADYGKTKAGLERTAKECEEKKQALAGLDARLEKLQAEQDGTRKELEQKKEAVRIFLETERREDDLKKNALELQQKKRELAETRFDKQAYIEAKEKLSGIIDEWNRIGAQRAGVSSDLINKEESLKKMLDTKAEIDKMREDIRRIRDSTDYLLQFQNALLSTQESLRKEFIESVNDTLEKIWAELYPYGDYRSARLYILEGDYVLQLQGRDGWVDVEGIVSGGERSTAALALRIAFSLVLAPHLKWLVLDEPTHNLDSKGIETLATLLRDRIGQYISQVFIITHEEKLEQAVTGYLYRLERNKDTDEPTRVLRAEV